MDMTERRNAPVTLELLTHLVSKIGRSDPISLVKFAITGCGRLAYLKGRFGLDSACNVAIDLLAG